MAGERTRRISPRERLAAVDRELRGENLTPSQRTRLDIDKQDAARRLGRRDEMQAAVLDIKRTADKFMDTIDAALRGE